MTSTMSILGLWTWDNTLFDNMALPSGVDAASVRDNILYSLADLEVLYPSAPFMKAMIEIWSKKELPTWERIYNASQLEYNPIENYDRQEEWTDSRDMTNTNTESAEGESRDTGSNTHTENNVTENYVAGYNEPSMVVSSKDVGTNQIVDSPNLKRNVDNTTTQNGSVDEDIIHKGRVHGNIGVTTSQQMLESELNLAPKLNIVDYIVNSFKMRFCILVY